MSCSVTQCGLHGSKRIMAGSFEGWIENHMVIFNAMLKHLSA
jgi:hypothetical protein